MQKHNLLVKKLKKQILSINDSIESYFNKLKNFNIKSISDKLEEQDYEDNIKNNLVNWSKF